MKSCLGGGRPPQSIMEKKGGLAAMNLYKWCWVIRGVAALCAVVFLIGAAFGAKGDMSTFRSLRAVAIGILAVGFVIAVITLRCPRCGKSIRMNTKMKVCPYCGEKLI